MLFNTISYLFQVFLTITIYILPTFVIQNSIFLCKCSQDEWLAKYYFASVMLLLFNPK